MEATKVERGLPCGQPLGVGAIQAGSQCGIYHLVPRECGEDIASRIARVSRIPLEIVFPHPVDPFLQIDPLPERHIGQPRTLGFRGGSHQARCLETFALFPRFALLWIAIDHQGNVLQQGNCAEVLFIGDGIRGGRAKVERLAFPGEPRLHFAPAARSAPVRPRPEKRDERHEQKDGPHETANPASSPAVFQKAHSGGREGQYDSQTSSARDLPLP